MPVIGLAALAFVAIVARADFTLEKIAFFLLDPHPPMPNFSLSGRSR
jgi:hypothetical protein